jgi:hypothetical protein
MIDDYQRLAIDHISLAEALVQSGDKASFVFEPPRLGGGIFKSADLD